MSLHQMSFAFSARDMIKLKNLAFSLSEECLIEMADEPGQQLFYIFEPGSSAPDWAIGRDRECGTYMAWDFRNDTMLAWGRVLDAVIVDFHDAAFGRPLLPQVLALPANILLA